MIPLAAPGCATARACTWAAALAAMFAAVLSAGSAKAAAWTLEPGAGQAITGATYTSGPRQFDGDGNSIDSAAYSKLEISSLVEYGVLDGFTLFVQPTVQAVDIGAPTNQSQVGLGYTELGGRLRLSRTDISAFSIQASARIPGAQDDFAAVNVGNTDPELDVRLLYGRGITLGGREGFVDLQAGYRHRDGDPASEIRADFSLGLRLRPDVLLLAQSFNVFSTGEPRGVFQDTRYHKAQISAVWDIGPAWSLQLGALATVAGKNALVERGATAALWMRF